MCSGVIAHHGYLWVETGAPLGKVCAVGRTVASACHRLPGHAGPRDAEPRGRRPGTPRGSCRRRGCENAPRISPEARVRERPADLAGGAGAGTPRGSRRRRGRGHNSTLDESESPRCEKWPLYAPWRALAVRRTSSVRNDLLAGHARHRPRHRPPDHHRPSAPPIAAAGFVAKAGSGDAVAGPLARLLPASIQGAFTEIAVPDPSGGASALPCPHPSACSDSMYVPEPPGSSRSWRRS